MWFRNRTQQAVDESTVKPDHEKSSILSRLEVLRSIANGAPAVPWALKPEDRQTIEKLATYFAQAIPVPTPDGRVRIEESIGYSGPQLELYVPVLSSKTPVAVLVRNWHSSSQLEPDLFFFGAPDGRLAAIVSRLGFVRRGESFGATVYQQGEKATQKKAS